MPRTEAQNRARQSYRKKIKRFTIDFSLSEQDLIDRIESRPKKQTYIKDLIRADIAREKGEH